MIFNDTIRDIIKSSQTVDSTHLVVAEWNMNRYQKISQYGIYKGAAANLNTSYSSSDNKIVDGKTFYIYDDDSIADGANQEYYSSLASVFQADRPEPGIILMQNYSGTLIVDKARDLRASRISVDQPRFYPFTKNRPYDYFNSGKLIDTSIASKNDKDRYSGTSTISGAINNANPFVVYENSFPCNKILISVQEYRSVPKTFAIDILDGNTWQEIYTVNSSSVWDDGILEIYYNSGTWSKTVSRVTNIYEIGTPSTQTVAIKGVRLRVIAMTDVRTVLNTRVRAFKASLELIEISPRIEMDVSGITEQFSFDSSLGDSEFGLPVGKLVSSTGNVTLSNESKQFLWTSSAANFNMMSPDVEFRFFQTVQDPVSLSSSNVPLKVLYADSWDVGQDFSVQISMSDKMRIFQETNVTDMALITKSGVPFSAIVLMLLDNLGITGYEFKKSNRANSDNEDIKITNFFCNREQTLADVLDKLAVATQSSMYFDAVGKLNVLTKERITSYEAIAESTSTTSGSTDFWFIYDQNYSSSPTELTYISDYKANIISAEESKIDPVTEGTVTYHTYGIRKKPGQSLLEDAVPKNILEDMPANSIVGTGFQYTPKIVWSPGSDNNAVLGAANLLKEVSASRLKDLFTSNINAVNEDGAVRQMVSDSLSSARASDLEKRKALLIYLDRNELYTFPEKSGYVMIDDEIIAYNGVVYLANGQIKVVFTDEELNELINSSNLRTSTIIPIALVVDVKFFWVSALSDGTSNYRVNGDGRAQFNTGVARHQQFNEFNTGLEGSDRFSMVIGGRPNATAPGERPKVTVNYDFSKAGATNRLKKLLRLPDENYKTYLGYLKIAGNRSPLADRRALNASTDSEVLQQQNKINKQVDKLVPGKKFDPYVYTLGERFIYGQKIDLGFAPNLVSTRMRLYSPRKVKKDKKDIMATNSSIAGIGIGLKMRRENGKNIITSGYFLEVETIGSGKDFAAKESFKNNLRFYKLESKNGLMTPELLAVGQVNAFTVSNLDAMVIADESVSGDPVFDLEIRIMPSDKGTEFKIYYSGQDISPREKIRDANVKQNYWTNNKNLFMFVRNDSEAIYEHVLAVAKRAGAPSIENVFNTKVEFDQKIPRGSIPQTIYDAFRKNDYRVYFNDFAKIARQVKKYTPRYNSPVLKSTLIDISRVNPQYMVKSAEFTAFGAEVVVANTSNTAIALSEDLNLPLYIYAPQLEELSTGNVGLTEIFEKIDDDGKKITDLQFNKSVYGIKGFNIDSMYIQNPSQARSLVRWIIRNCSRQRFKISAEVFANPLLELGDKVRVFSLDRGYRIENAKFGNKTFVVSEINRSVTQEGPSMKVTLVEVGEN